MVFGDTLDSHEMSGNQRRSAEREATLFRSEVTQETLSLIFNPIMAILNVKRENLEMQVIVAEKFKRWLDRKPEGTDQASFDKFAQEGTVLQKRMADTEVWSSFATKDDPDAWRRAADYSETMVSGTCGL